MDSNHEHNTLYKRSDVLNAYFSCRIRDELLLVNKNIRDKNINQAINYKKKQYFVRFS